MKDLLYNVYYTNRTDFILILKDLVYLNKTSFLYYECNKDTIDSHTYLGNLSSLQDEELMLQCYKDFLEDNGK